MFHVELVPPSASGLFAREGTAVFVFATCENDPGFSCRITGEEFYGGSVAGHEHLTGVKNSVAQGEIIPMNRFRDLFCLNQG